jgi:FtsZ-binding cell division protein ZapB
MTYDEIVKALRCGETIGGWCYKDCKNRENDHCELQEYVLRHDAADEIERLTAENGELQEDNNWLRESSKIIDDKAKEVSRENKNLRNELCLKCGRYKTAHKGACDGCRWKKGECHCAKATWRGERSE